MKSSLLLLQVAVLFLAGAMLVVAYTVREHSIRLKKLECVHYVYEDNSAVHEDAELATACIGKR